MIEGSDERVPQTSRRTRVRGGCRKVFIESVFLKTENYHRLSPMSPPIVPTSFSLAEKPTEPRATLSYPYGSIHHPTAHIATSTGSDFNRTLTKMAVFSFLFTFLTAIIYTSTFARPATATIAFLPTNQFKQWAQYSPWYPVEPYRPPPRLCKVTQACPSVLAYRTQFPLTSFVG